MPPAPLALPTLVGAAHFYQHNRNLPHPTTHNTEDTQLNGEPLRHGPSDLCPEGLGRNGVNRGPPTKYRQCQSRRRRRRRRRFRSWLSLPLPQPIRGALSPYHCRQRRWLASRSIVIRRSRPARRPLRTASSLPVLTAAGCRRRRRTVALAGADCLKSQKMHRRGERYTASNCERQISTHGNLYTARTLGKERVRRTRACFGSITMKDNGYQ